MKKPIIILLALVLLVPCVVLAADTAFDDGTALTTGTLADTTIFPASEGGAKNKLTWSVLVAKAKAYFDTLYQGVLTNSAGLAAALSDETGQGPAVLGIGPTISGPYITAAEVDGHASISLTAAQVSSTIVYNTGQAAADVALGLPPAAEGYNALFAVGTAQNNKWGVQADTNDKIYQVAADGTISAGSDNGYARMTAAQVGQFFACWTFKTDAYDWACKAISIGTSTFAAN